MRLLLDSSVSTSGIGKRLAALGHDVGALDHEPAFDTLADEEVLELATKDGSILVTMNSSDFPPILREWAAAGRSHAGVIILHGVTPADFDTAVAAVSHTLKERPAQIDWTDRAVVAPGA